MSGAIASWRWVGSSSRPRTVTSDYVGRITSIVDNGPSPGNTISYTYDGDGGLLSETASGPGTSWLMSAASQSFPHSRTFSEQTNHDVLKSWVDDGAAESLIYWGSLRRDRESAAGLTFYYDYYSATPERLSSKTALNVDDSREVMLAYDSAGRVTTLDWAPFSSVDVGLIYGPLGQLTGRSVTGLGTYRYSYDHDMRLVKQVYPDGTTRRSRYVGGRNPMVDELLPANGSSKKYWEHIYLGGEPVAQVAEDANGSALRLLITDRMGRVRKLTNTSGASLVRYVWDAWGDSNGAYLVNDLVEEPMPEYAWGLPGQRGVGNGVTLNGWRAYVPEIGQYTTPEPLHAAAAAVRYGPTAYSYAGSAPLTYTDPSAQFPPAWAAALWAIAEGSGAGLTGATAAAGSAGVGAGAGIGGGAAAAAAAGGLGAGALCLLSGACGPGGGGGGAGEAEGDVDDDGLGDSSSDVAGQGAVPPPGFQPVPVPGLCTQPTKDWNRKCDRIADDMIEDCEEEFRGQPRLLLEECIADVVAWLRWCKGQI